MELVHSQTATESSSTRDKTVFGRIKSMARAADSNGFLLKALAMGAIGAAIFGILTAINNSNRLTRLEAQTELATHIDQGFERLERAIRESR